MRTLGILTIAAGLLTVIACSSSDPGGSVSDDSHKHSVTPDPGTDNSDQGTNTGSPVTPPPPPPPVDAGTAVDLSKDGRTDGDETDVDCGGRKAPGCADGRSCRVASDCKNNVCTSGVCKPPAVQTNYCSQLAKCCDSISNTFEKLACVGIQIAGKEIACQGQLLACGTGIEGTQCGNLNKCCDQIYDEGYDDSDCRSEVADGNQDACGSYLSGYKNDGYCN
jgi:hypothetical protein